MISLHKKQKAYSFGIHAERLAAFYLACKGYRIIAMRYRNQAGEIDIVARRGKILIVVEVKARSALEDCMEAITPAKQQKIARATELMLAGSGKITGLVPQPNPNIRFDVIWVVPWSWPKHIKDAWRM